MPSENDSPEAQHSISQMSYDQRTNTMSQLASLLINTPNYNPTEVEYKATTIQLMQTQMLDKPNAVAQTFVALNNARTDRNQIFYNGNESLVDTAYKTKDYLYAILDIKSVQYKAISKIRFYRS
ncbi:MAG: hypothetical protein ABI426_00615 [Flavobacterium sp.]